MKVKNIKYHQYDYKTPSKNLQKYIKMLEDAGVEDPAGLLPKATFETLGFELSESYSAFANAFRRTLIEDIPVQCMALDDKDFKTDDRYLLIDVVKDRLSIIHILQDEFPGIKISLKVYNKTSSIISVYASDIVTIYNGKRIALIPNDNIEIFRLRPNKTLELKNIYLERGYGKNNPTKFTLPSNIQYRILDVEPYNIFTKTGSKSTEVNPQEFYIGFKTSGNISAKDVIRLVQQELTSRLMKVKKQILGEEVGLEIQESDGVMRYRFTGEYITMAMLLAQTCYRLDNTVDYCSGTFDRFDNEVAIVSIKHPEHHRLLLDSVDSIVDDINHVCKQIISAEKSPGKTEKK